MKNAVERKGIKQSNVVRLLFAPQYGPNSKSHPNVIPGGKGNTKEKNYVYSFQNEKKS